MHQCVMCCPRGNDMANDIKLPFTSSYCLMWASILAPEMAYALKAHDKDQIDAILASPAIKEDFARTPWRLGEHSISDHISDGMTPSQIFTTIEDFSKQAGINLLPYEVKAINAFAMHSGGTTLQGGILRIAQMLFYSIWLKNHEVIPYSNSKSIAFNEYIDVKRSSDHEIDIIYVQKNNSLATFNQGDATPLPPQGDPYIQCQFHFSISEGKNNFKIKVIEKDCAIKINENLWNTHFLARAKESLKNSMALSKEDCFNLIPLLNDPEINKMFFNKLVHQSPEIIKLTIEAINLNFSKTAITQWPDYWNKLDNWIKIKEIIYDDNYWIAQSRLSSNVPTGILKIRELFEQSAKENQSEDALFSKLYALSESLCRSPSLFRNMETTGAFYQLLNQAKSIEDLPPIKKFKQP